MVDAISAASSSSSSSLTAFIGHSNGMSNPIYAQQQQRHQPHPQAQASPSSSTFSTFEPSSMTAASKSPVVSLKSPISGNGHGSSGSSSFVNGKTPTAASPAVAAVTGKSSPAVNPLKRKSSSASSPVPTAVSQPMHATMSSNMVKAADSAAMKNVKRENVEEGGEVGVMATSTAGGQQSVSDGGRIDGKVWLAQQVDKMEAALKEAVYQRALVLRYHAEVRQQNILHLTEHARTPIKMRDAYLKACREWQETSRRVKAYMERCRETYQSPVPAAAVTAPLSLTADETMTDVKPSSLAAAAPINGSSANGADPTHAIDVDEQDANRRAADPIVIDVDEEDDNQPQPPAASTNAAELGMDRKAELGAGVMDGSSTDKPSTNGMGGDSTSAASVAQSQPIVVDDMTQGASSTSAMTMTMQPQEVPGAIAPGMAELAVDPTVGTADFDFFDFDMDDGGGGGGGGGEQGSGTTALAMDQAGQYAQAANTNANDAAAVVTALDAVMASAQQAGGGPEAINGSLQPAPPHTNAVAAPISESPIVAVSSAPPKAPSIPPPSTETTTTAPAPAPIAPTAQPPSGPPSYGITPPPGMSDGLGADFDLSGDPDFANMDLSQYSELFGYGDLSGLGDDAMGGGDFGTNSASYLDAGQT